MKGESSEDAEGNQSKIEKQMKRQMKKERKQKERTKHRLREEEEEEEDADGVEKAEGQPIGDEGGRVEDGGDGDGEGGEERGQGDADATAAVEREIETLQREMCSGISKGMPLCKGRKQKQERLTQTLVRAGKSSSASTAASLAACIEEAVFDHAGRSWKSKQYKSLLHNFILKLKEERCAPLVERLVRGHEDKEEALPHGRDDAETMSVEELVLLKGKRLDEAAAAAGGKNIDPAGGLAFPAQRGDVMELRSAFVTEAETGPSGAADGDAAGKQSSEWKLEKFRFGESLIAEPEAKDQAPPSGADGKKPVEEQEPQSGDTKDALNDGPEAVGEDELGACTNNEEDAAVQDTGAIIQGEARTKVYCGGCPYWATEDDIAGFFEPYCGEIISIDTLKFPDSGKFNGIAFITFAEETAAKAAVAYDGEYWERCQLKIREYKRGNGGAGSGPDGDGDGTGRKKSKLVGKRQKVEGSTTAYVGNLDWETQEATIRDLFAECSIKSVRFGRDASGKFKGFVHVEFDTEDDLERAIRSDGTVINGRPCAIHYSESKQRQEGRTGETVPGKKRSEHGRKRSRSHNPNPKKRRR